MFLNDAFGNTVELDCIYTHHEQAAAMAALGYSKAHGVGVCVTTTGCGATNAITGLLDAWQDSQPILFISGQVKKGNYLSLGLVSRFWSPRIKHNSNSIFANQKGYLHRLKSEYFSFLENAQEWLFHGRPGPVWIDIPMIFSLYS